MQKWKKPEHSRTKIENVGRRIKRGIETDADISIANDRRTAHAYPLHIFYSNFARRAKAKGGIPAKD